MIQQVFFLSAKMQTWVNKASYLGFRVYFHFKKTPQKTQPTTTINQKKQQHTKHWVTQTYVHALNKIKKKLECFQNIKNLIIVYQIRKKIAFNVGRCFVKLTG